MAVHLIAPCCADAELPDTQPARFTIPYVATRHDIVRDMLWLADVGTEDVVYDLGSGDGRIAIAAVRDFGARRSVGIEKDPGRVRESRENAAAAGVADRVGFIDGDLFTSDFSEASVLALFLGHGPNLELRPRIFRTLRPGSRIVSNQFAMGEWETDKMLIARTVTLGMWGEAMNPFRNNPRVPAYTGNESHFGTSSRISMWVVPAPVAGVWRGKIRTAEGLRELRMVLHQRLSSVSGRFELDGPSPMTDHVGGELWGDHVRCWLSHPQGPHGRFEVRFDGHVRDDTMAGTLGVADQGRIEERPWEARRDRADLTGTWEWPCASGPRPVRLRIKRWNDQLTATYLDRGLGTPVVDFYDFGGGFYFTLLVGRQAYGIVVTDDTGWLIGRAVVEDGVLTGTIEFHPYKTPSEARSGRPQPWTPQRVIE